MYLEFLQLKNFRNYKNLDLELHKNINILVGQNGQGKTNLVESIYFALNGHSFRAVEKSDLKNIEFSNQPLEIKARLNHRNLIKSLQVQLNANKIDIQINNYKSRIADLKRQFNVIVFSPDSLMVIKQGSNERREFLDEIAISIDKNSIDIIQNYTKCLKAKNRIIKLFKSNEIQRLEALNLLESLEANFVKAAAQLTNIRIETLKTIANLANNEMKLLSQGRDVDISVDYIISDQSAIAWSRNQVYDSLKSRVNELVEAELAAGHSLAGPHRHDLRIFLNGHDLRTFGSQGQQRTAILAFKLALLKFYVDKFGDNPILILDDVFSELDVEIRQNVLNVLIESEAQKFISTTEIDLPRDWTKDGCKKMFIEKGIVNSGWK